MSKRQYGMQIVGWALAALFVLLAAGRAHAFATRLEADAYASSTATTANYGAKNRLDVAGPVDNVRTGYVRFDLSTLPSGTTGADVAKATLTVFVNKVTTGGSLDVVRVTGTWAEPTITGGSSPTLGATEQSAIPITAADPGQFKTVDVTAVVKDWLDGVLTNNGLALRANAVDGLDARFDSKENKANGQEPRLEIALSSGGGGTVTNVSAASPLSVTNPSTTPNITLGTVPVILGGTGASTASAARANLGAAVSGGNPDITSLQGLAAGSPAAPAARFAGDGDTGLYSPAPDTLAIATGGMSRMSVDTSAVTLSGNLELPNSTATAGNVTKGGTLFLHNFGTDNTFLGAQAGNLMMVGFRNTGVGPAALFSNTTGTNNVAVGYGALQSNTTGFNNTALGSLALSSNQSLNNTALGAFTLLASTTGAHNTAVGGAAMMSNTTGSNNVGLGVNALFSNDVGVDNVGVGVAALSANTSGQQNTAVGRLALASNTTGFQNTAVGEQALLQSTVASLNNAFGHFALANNTTGFDNTAVGWRTLFLNTSGSRDTAVGNLALNANTFGNENTAVGHGALSANTSASLNNAFGYFALGSNTTGSDNTAVGWSTLFSNTTGSKDTAVGNRALSANTTGEENTAVGYGALSFSTTAHFNNAFGHLALGSNTTGFDNTAVGWRTLFSNATGSKDTAVGNLALNANTTGNENTAVGHGALSASTTASFNSALGARALESNTTGIANVALGHAALISLTAGDRNTAIGGGAGSLITTGSDNIMINNNGTAAENATIRIGNNAHTSAFMAGIFGQTSTSGTAVFVNASGKLGTMTSSARYKTDVADMRASSSGLMRLRPVTFRYKPDIDPEGLTQYGLIAEEVAQVYPDLVQRAEDGSVYTVRYHLLVPMLLNEVQKLSAETARLRADTERLQHVETVLLERLDKLERAAAILPANALNTVSVAVKPVSTTD